MHRMFRARHSLLSSWLVGLNFCSECVKRWTAWVANKFHKHRQERRNFHKMWQEEPKEENTTKQVDSLRLFLNYHERLRMLRRTRNQETHPQHEFKKKSSFWEAWFILQRAPTPNVKFILVKSQRKKLPIDCISIISLRNVVNRSGQIGF